MSNRLATHADVYEKIVGKTIASVDSSCANVTIFTFTDGSRLDLETEHVGCGIYGIESRFVEKGEFR